MARPSLAQLLSRPSVGTLPIRCLPAHSTTISPFCTSTVLHARRNDKRRTLALYPLLAPPHLPHQDQHTCSKDPFSIKVLARLVLQRLAKHIPNRLLHTAALRRRSQLAARFIFHLSCAILPDHHSSVLDAAFWLLDGPPGDSTRLHPPSISGTLVHAPTSASDLPTSRSPPQREKDLELMNSANMETEQHHSQENEFGTSQWVEMGGYSGSQHQSPLHEYGGFGFVSPTIMPVEPSYSMSIPPPYTSHQQLQPLIMPQWPSMMTSQANYSAPVLPTVSASAPTSAITAPPPMPPLDTTTTSTKPASTPRKTLTHEDRRMMCLYHEEHPGVKQTEIGGKCIQLIRL
jgi:hypothetical protein